MPHRCATWFALAGLLLHTDRVALTITLRRIDLTSRSRGSSSEWRWAALNDPPRWNQMDNDAIVAALPEHGTDSGCGDEMHFMITQGIRDRKTLKVNYPLPNKKGPVAHFFAMEVTWK